MTACTSRSSLMLERCGSELECIVSNTPIGVNKATGRLVSSQRAVNHVTRLPQDLTGLLLNLGFRCTQAKGYIDSSFFFSVFAPVSLHCYNPPSTFHLNGVWSANYSHWRRDLTSTSTVLRVSQGHHPLQASWSRSAHWCWGFPRGEIRQHYHSCRITL